MTPVKLIRYATLAHLDSLFCGDLIGLCCENRAYLEKFHLPHWLKHTVGVLLLIALFYSGYLFDNFFNNPHIKYAVYTTLSCAILFLARENDGWFRYGGWIQKLLVWCGDRSASVYVSHVILYSCVYHNIYYRTSIIPDWVKNTVPGTIAQVLFLIVTACWLGHFSYHFIEAPYGLLARTRLHKETNQT